MTLGLTPSQTVGPFFAIMLDWPDGDHAVPDGTEGAIWLRGRLFDGAGAPVPDGLIELWQAGNDPRFARCRTDASGLINRVGIAIGFIDENKPWQFTNDPTPFLSVPSVLWWLLLVVVWASVGFYMVLFSAAMQSIPRDIYEAAMLDGATRIHTFFRVTLPLLRDSVSVAWVYIGFLALDMYVWVYVLTPQQGGPNHSSEVFGTVMLREAFNYGQFGYACAMGVAMAAFALILGGLQLSVGRRERIEY